MSAEYSQEEALPPGYLQFYRRAERGHIHVSSLFKGKGTIYMMCEMYAKGLVWSRGGGALH